MNRLMMIVATGLLALFMTGCTEQEVMAARGRPQPVIIIVE